MKSKCLQLSLGVVVCVSSVARAEAVPQFDALKANAEALTSLASFVEHYVGDCATAMMGGGDCAKNAEAFRKTANGKRYSMIVVEESTSVLQMGETTSASEFILNLTPFFAASDSALTQGAPSKTDAKGNPIIPFIRINGTLPEGWNMGIMGRQVQAHALRMQVVFTVQGVWTLPKKGGGSIRGVKSKIEGIVVTVGRTGERVGTWFAK